MKSANSNVNSNNTLSKLQTKLSGFKITAYILKTINISQKTNNNGNILHSKIWKKPSNGWLLLKFGSTPVLLLTSVIFTSGCSKGNEANQVNNPPQEKITSASNSETIEKPIETKLPARPRKDMTLSVMTLNTVLESVRIPLQASNMLSPQTLQCVNQININFALNPVQNFFEEKFTPEELNELNTLYKTDSAKIYTQYGRDQLLVSAGLPVQTLTQKPNQAHMDTMNEFAKSKLGKKYIKITKSKKAGSLTALVMPLLTEELKKCGVETTQDITKP